MILNTAQAEAVYAAMVALNNVGGNLNNINIPLVGKQEIVVKGSKIGAMSVCHFEATRPIGREDYPSQYAFATAYGLN